VEVFLPLTGGGLTAATLTFDQDDAPCANRAMRTLVNKLVAMFDAMSPKLRKVTTPHRSPLQSRTILPSPSDSTLANLTCLHPHHTHHHLVHNPTNSPSALRS
jgi:hypothetical protein